MPLVAMDSATSPIIPRGANRMIQPTTVVIACAMDSITSFVFIGAWRKAPPMISAQPKIPM